MPHIDRPLALAAVLASALVLASCRKGSEGASDTTAGAAQTSPMPAAGETTATGAQPAAGGAASSSEQPSDANILAKEIGSDSSEVAIAEFAHTKASNAGVKSYAQMLVDDHSKGRREAQSLARTASINPQPPANDTTAQMTTHVLERLRSTPKGVAFDTAFVNHEVEDHQHDIDEAHRMEAAAKDARVRDLVHKSIPELQKHLDRAQQLQQQLGRGK